MHNLCILGLVTVLVLWLTGSMKILQLNTRAISTYKRYIENYAESARFDVICLSETWNRDDAPKVKNFTHYWKNRKHNNKGGVAILVNKGVKAVYRKDLETDKLEAIWVEACIGKQRTLIASIYIPPGHKEDITALEGVIDKIPSSTAVVLTGDFNARSSLWDNGSRVGVAWTLGNQLEQLAVTHGFHILNDGTPTRIFGGFKSAPDVSLSRGVTCPVKWQVNHDIVVRSDHSPVILNYDEGRPATKSRWNLSGTDWDSWKTQLDAKMESSLLSAHDDTTAEEACRTFTDDILQCANENISRKEICVHSKPFITEKVKNLLTECKAARRRYRKRSDPKNWRIAKAAVAAFMEAFREAKQEWLDNISEEVKLASGDMWKKVNKMIKGSTSTVVQPIRLTNGDYTFDDAEISDRLRDVHITRTHVNTDDFDNDWYCKINSDTEEIITKEVALGNKEDLYNSDITIEEVNGAINKMKKHSAPGPDQILPIMISEAGDVTKEALQQLFQKCWSSYSVPSIWKEENRIYIPKPGKDDYHIEKASRPLSLTSSVGKLMERIICQRLVWYLEAAGLMDPLQFAYRRNHSISQAILLFVMDILEGFKKNENTVATFVDLEGAFDSVWREAVVYKLAEIGIKGRMLLYIADYLRGRRARNLVNTHESTWINTELGVPQGSVISPILFIIFIKNMTSSIPKKIGYADDLFDWTRHVDISAAESEMKDHVRKLMNWNRKWRLTINLSKTEVICFCKSGHIYVNITVDGKTLRQVTSKVCLGVLLDQNLTFREHTDRTSRRALGALTRISALMADIGGMKMEIGTALYKACVRPHLEYAYPVWCFAPEEQLRKLERVQRIALLRATGTVSSTPASALEVLTSVPPLRIRYQEILAQEYIRILRKPHDNLLRSTLLYNLANPSFMDHKVLTPLHHIKMAVGSLCREFSPERVDHEPRYNLGMLNTSMVTRITNSWKTLGNSKNRTTVQAEEARRITEQQLRETDDNTIIAFTDGSALGNPGPCGAAAIIYANGIDSQPMAIRKAVSKKSTSYHGELQAIYIAMDFAVNYSALHSISKLRIFSDCQSAILTVTDSQLNNNFTSLASDIQERVKQLYTNNISIDICWVAGHAGLAANELADVEAKLAAHEAEHLEESEELSPLSLSEAKGAIKKAVVERWQKSWDTAETGRHYHRLKPTVDIRSVRSHVSRNLEIKLNRIKTGHTKLRDHMYKIGACDSPLCDCELANETVDHKIFHCALLNNSRDVMIDSIELGYVKTNTHPWDRTFDIANLTGDNTNLTPEMNTIIRQAFSKFLSDSIPVI
jgi:ribonuclease HI/retron-type reverse transcriptase